MWAWGGGSAKRCRIPPAVGLLLGLAAAPSLAAPPAEPTLSRTAPASDDYGRGAWWLEVKERRRVILEAAGRNLADLRLWSNGSWLVDAEPAREVVAAQPGRPMLVCRLAADFSPGL